MKYIRCGERKKKSEGVMEPRKTRKDKGAKRGKYDNSSRALIALNKQLLKTREEMGADHMKRSATERARDRRARLVQRFTRGDCCPQCGRIIFKPGSWVVRARGIVPRVVCRKCNHKQPKGDPLLSAQAEERLRTALETVRSVS